MAIVFECPVCEFQGKAADEQQGKEINCKGCGHKFILTGKPTGSSSSGNAASVAAVTTKAATTTATDYIATRCPSCGTKGKVPSSARGRKIKCPKCSEAFIVGTAPAAASGPAAKLLDGNEPAESAPEPAGEAVVEVVPKALEEVKAAGDVGLKPLEGAEVVDDDDQGGTYEVVDDAAILIEAACPKCKHKGNVPQKFAGKKVKCPRCSAMFVIGDPNQGKQPAKPATAPQPPAADFGNPFAGLDAPGSAKLSAPSQLSPAPPDDNPFAFDAPSSVALPPQWQPASFAEKSLPASGDDRSQPRSRMAKKLEKDEARADITTMWIAGGVMVFLLVVGGIIALLVMRGTSTPDTRLALATVPEVPSPPAAMDHKSKPPEPAVKPPLPDPKTNPDPKTIPDPEPQPKPPDVPLVPKVEPPPAKEVTWIDASRESGQIGSTRVRAVFAWVDHLQTPAGRSPKPHLLIRLQLENSSGAKEVIYHSWGNPDPVPGKGAPARLTDHLGKVYPLATRAQTIVRSPDQLETETILPGKVVDDLLVFEPVTGPVDYIRLELPAVNLGGETTLGLHMPKEMIDIRSGGKTPLVKGPDAKDPPPDKALADKIKLLRAVIKPNQGLPAQRVRYVEQLGEMGPAAAPAVMDLIALLRTDRDEFVRASAAQALGKIGPGAKVAIIPLTNALADNFFKVKANAAEALGSFGPDAKEAVPRLLELQKSKDEEVAQKVAVALSKIDQRGRPPLPKKK